MTLTAVEITSPALVFRQAQRRQTLLCGMTMRMLRTGWQLGEVQAWQVEQGDIYLPLSGLYPLTVAPEMLPPGIECRLAFSRGPIFFICDDNICAGELIAEVVVGHRFFIQQLSRVEQAKRGA